MGISVKISELSLVYWAVKRPLLVLSWKKKSEWVVVVHTFNPSTRSQRQEDLYELEARLVYRMRFRTAKATQRYLS